MPDSGVKNSWVKHPENPKIGLKIMILLKMRIIFWTFCMQSSQFQAFPNPEG